MKIITSFLMMLLTTFNCFAATVVLDFENKEDLSNVKSHNWREGFTKEFPLVLSGDFPSNGKNALRINLPLGGCPGVIMEIKKGDCDWSKFKTLKMDVFNAEADPVLAYTVVVDKENVINFEGTEEEFPYFDKVLLKPGKNIVELKLENVKKNADIKEIKEIIVCIPDRTLIPLLLHLDAIRLEE